MGKSWVVTILASFRILFGHIFLTLLTPMSRLSTYLHAFSAIKHNLKMKSRTWELSRERTGLENRRKKEMGRWKQILQFIYQS